MPAMRSFGGAAFWGRRGIRSVAFALAAFAFAALAAIPAAAQQPAAPAGAPAALEPAEIEALIGTLEDPAARERLIRQLRALQAVLREEAAAEPAQEGFGARILAALSENVLAVSEGVVAAAGVLTDLPDAARWLGRRLADPAARAAWLEGLAKIAGALAAGALAEWLVRRLLRRFDRSLRQRNATGWLLRLPLAPARFALELAPLAAFAAAAYGLLPLTEPRETTRLVAIALINAHVAVGLTTRLARILLAPAAPGLRLVPTDDETANYAFIWVRRLAVVTIYGYMIAEAALLLGLEPAAHGFFLRLLGLAILAMAAVLVLQNRPAVAAAIRGRGEGGSIGTLRHRLAEVWHVLALLYLVAVYVIWALEVDGGFGFLLRATVLSAVVLLLARLLVAGLRRLIARGSALSAELRRQFPGLEERANRYLPLVQRVLAASVWAVAALLLLEVWGVDSFGWLATDLGRRIFGSLLAIALIVAGAALLSELVGALIERYLERSDREGQPTARRARIRTLLPLLRNAFRVLLALLVVLIVLSEIGIDIGPLLAAAGVVGLAIGFGAQTLVKDIITGFLILAEDQISVGDVVEVGGNAGLVEAITIRTIRLRSFDGTTHTLPFSAVTTIKNLTKDFSYAVFDIGVAYREDVDEVMRLIEQLGAELQADEVFGREILAPIEVLGVDRFADSAVIIKARIKTAPIKQWMVMREFNRRMKRLFDEKGIEIPFPHQTIYFGEDRRGHAPPVRVALQRTPEPGG